MRCEYLKVKCVLVDRGISGIGSSFGQVPFEVGLNFDPILNMPYILGSSIKGAVRAAFNTYFKENKDIEDKLFGDTSVGLVRFSDAYPISLGRYGLLLYPDVITPHYSNAKDELTVTPNPIVYLTIAPETKFIFYVYWRKNSLSNSEKYMLKLALLLALARGIGARTSVGYSSFKVLCIDKVIPDE